MSAVQAGGIEDWHQAGESPSTSERAEAVRVAEAAENRRCGDRADARSGAQDAVRVGGVQQQRGPLVEVFQFLGYLQRQTGFDRDVFGEVVVVQLASRPQLERFTGGGEQGIRVWFA